MMLNRCKYCGGWCFYENGEWKCVNCGRTDEKVPDYILKEVRDVIEGKRRSVGVGLH